MAAILEYVSVFCVQTSTALGYHVSTMTDTDQQGCKSFNPATVEQLHSYSNSSNTDTIDTSMDPLYFLFVINSINFFIFEGFLW